tara:strand:- start:51 stop:1037 length:987 start_codon:yes stop_codon:yes gene_type:complete
MSYILITGGAGYIGSHICKKFFDEGFIPVTFDNLSKGNKWSVKWGPLELGDLSDEGRLKSLFEKYSFIGVIHLAALSNVEQSCAEPNHYYKNNVVGSFNLIQKMIEFKVKNIVFSSTAAVYGNPIYLPIDEKHPTHPINPYGDTKLAIEKLMYNYSKAYEFNFISLRYFNVSGSDFKNKIGEDHNPETHIIPLALESIKKNNTFNIYGDDYNTKDGTCIRDFIHVKDLGNAHFLSFKKLLCSKMNEFINVGCGKGFSVYEILNSAKKITKMHLSISIVKRRDGDPDTLISNIDKAKKLLAWEPQHSDIDLIIYDSWKWYQKKFVIKIT